MTGASFAAADSKASESTASVSSTVRVLVIPGVWGINVWRHLLIDVLSGTPVRHRPLLINSPPSLAYSRTSVGRKLSQDANASDHEIVVRFFAAHLVVSAP